tara:strand:- start:1522 stop:2139 length:618 start_codon:yes stop_codon:yes gene_type:complete
MDWLTVGKVYTYEGVLFRDKVFYESKEEVESKVVYYLSVIEENDSNTVKVSIICQPKNKESKFNEVQIDLLREVCLPELKIDLDKKTPTLPKYLGFGPYELHPYDKVKKMKENLYKGNFLEGKVKHDWQLRYIPKEEQKGVMLAGDLKIENDKGLIPTKKNLTFDIFYIYENQKIKHTEMVFDYLLEPFNVSSTLRIQLRLIEDA